MRQSNFFDVVVRRRALLFSVVGLLLSRAHVAQAEPLEPQEAGEPTHREIPSRISLLGVNIAAGVGGEPSERDDLAELASSLDEILEETAKDLALTANFASAKAPLDVLDPALSVQANREQSLVLAASIAPGGDVVAIRLAMAVPGRRALIARAEQVRRSEVPVRVAVMFRDMLGEVRAKRTASNDKPVEVPGGIDLSEPPESDGKLILAVNATVFGGFVGYSIQRSSGSDDPRLLYPLLALGSGVGLGGSLLVAEEWDIRVGDAWFLSAASWWPSAGAMLIFQGRFAQYRSPEESDEATWTYGLIGGTTGVSIAALGLTLGHIDDGGAVLAHSGGGLGMVLGGLSEMAVEGKVDFLPEAGMGYGAALGWLTATAVALHVEPTPSRVLLMDLGAFLGGMGGAALSSPLLFDDPSADQQRAWLAIIGGSAVAGGTLGVVLSADEQPAAEVSVFTPLPGETRPSVLVPVDVSPLIGVIGETPDEPGHRSIVGLGARGRLH